MSSPSLAEAGRVLLRAGRCSLQLLSNVPSFFMFLLMFSLRRERITLMTLILFSDTLKRIGKHLIFQTLDID